MGSTNHNHAESWIHTFVYKASTLTILGILIMVLIIGTGEMFHGQLLRLGEVMFGDPKVGVQYSFLRGDMSKPACDPNPNIAALVDADMNKPLDEVEQLLGTVRDRAAITTSITQSIVDCKEKHNLYTKLNEHKTLPLKIYRGFEKAFFGLFHFGTENRPLILVFMLSIAAIVTALGRHHIALRPPSSKLDFKVYNISMLVASGLMLYSSISYWFSEQASGVAEQGIAEWINFIWIGAFAILTLISLIDVFKKAPDHLEKGNLAHAFLSIPLFASMAIITGVAFIGFMNYSVGLQIYLGQLMDFSAMYLQLALYIWAGVLLKKTLMMDRFLDVFRPFKFSPETLTLFIMLGAAICTAYTGASGIFVVAAGSVIFKEVLAAGGRPQYALASAAMSGSLGVVLAPCLLIVLIAAMNKQVTTDELFHYGFFVFLVSTGIFYGISLLLAKEKFQLAKPKDAFPEFLKNLRNVLPYLLIAILVIAFYRYGLNTKFDEFTAPMIVPLLMVMYVIYDNTGSRKTNRSTLDTHGFAENEKHANESAFQALFGATQETVGHIGALILLMGLSISVGGLIDRSEILLYIPHSLGGVLPSLCIFMVVLMFVGMTMDPYGALILISATVAPVAYANGIHPVHFWMIALTAFEFGYLCPPVALNQLLARQSVGEHVISQIDSSVSQLSFYWKYERWILPLIVMGLVMVIVTFAPYVLGMFKY